MSTPDINPDFTKGLVPAIIQDSITKNILMLGYMNEEAYRKTRESNLVTFFSRSRNAIWTKGETSENYLHVVSIEIDCDMDTLLVRARPDGPVCHTGAQTCFRDSNNGNDLSFLENVIQDRIRNPKNGSYTNELMNKGINKVAQKVGEEAVELVIEAKDENSDLFLNEAADLMYHYLVLLAAKGHQLDDVIKILRDRHK